MDKQTLKTLDVTALQEKIKDFEKELFHLRLNASSGQVKDSSQFRKLRVGIARAKTFLKKKNVEKTK